MTAERAIEILDPRHSERYDSIETVNEACCMGMEALKNPLLAFIKQEVPFRLSQVLGIGANQQTPELVEEMVYGLWEDSSLMFDYDAIDSFLLGILQEHNIEAEDGDGDSEEQ